MNKIFLIFCCGFLLLPIFVFATDKIDINTATLEQLDLITGIGPKYAQAIIDGRPYSSVDDLLRVKGIGEKTLQKIKEQGLACISCSQEMQEISNSQLPISNEFSNSNDDTAPVTPIVYPGGIFINEIMPSPEGADEDSEWVELYNSNDFEVNLTDWKIQDSIGTKTTYTIKQKIPGFGFLVLERPETKITLNNDQDGLTLFSPDNKTIDSAFYEEAEVGLSYVKVNSSWQWSTSPTPGAKNIIASPQALNSLKGLPKTEKSDRNNVTETGLAGLNQTIIPTRNEISNGANPWFLFFTALGLTIISAATVLLIKFKLKQNNVRT